MNSPTNLHLYILTAPLIAAFAVNLLGRISRAWVAPLTLGSLLFSTIGSLLMLVRVLREGGFSYTVGNWTPPFGIELLIDPLSALMLVLVSGVTLTATVAALPWVEREHPGSEHFFFTLYLILTAGLIGLVLTADAFNLYVLLEITSITTYGLIAMGKGRAPLASFNYIIMGTVGACFYLLGIGYLYMLTGTLNMADIAAILKTVPQGPALATAFAFVVVGLWIKMAFFPLHGWLPNAYALAPTGAGLLFAPLMTKVTIYLMIRVILNVFTPEYAFYSRPMVQSGVVWGAAIAIVCASCLALGQRDLRRMLTYLIIAEVGYMVGGFWLANTQGMTGAILHIFNDAVMTLCLFLAAAAIASRTGSLSFDSLKGLYRSMPVTMAAFTVGAFALIGVPPTCGFFSKWYLLQGAVQAGQWGFMAALVLSSLINAVLFFRIIELAYFNTNDPRHDHGQQHGQRAARIQEAPLPMLVPLVLSATAILIIGLGSGPLVTIIRTVLPQPF